MYNLNYLTLYLIVVRLVSAAVERPNIDVQHPLAAITSAPTQTGHIFPKITPGPTDLNYESKKKAPDNLLCQEDLAYSYDYCAAMRDDPWYPWSPTTIGYTILSTTCASTTLYVRPVTTPTLNPSEQAWAVRRQRNAAMSIGPYLTRAWSGKVQYPAVLDRDFPRVGLAFSGGGYRAMLNGAGVLQAFDGSNTTAINARTGGLLQSSLYITGLSGGSWLVGSWALNNYPSMTTMVSRMCITFLSQSMT
jgi:hypothetical protein